MQYQAYVSMSKLMDSTAMTWRTLNTVTRHVGRACLGLGLELEISNDWIPVSSSVQAGPLSRSLVQCPGSVYLETAAMEQRWEASYSSAGGGYPAHDKWSLAAVFTILLLCCYSLHRLIESCPRTLGRRRRDEEQTQNLTWRNRLLIMNRKNSACCFTVQVVSLVLITPAG